MPRRSDHEIRCAIDGIENRAEKAWVLLESQGHQLCRDRLEEAYRALKAMAEVLRWTLGHETKINLAAEVLDYLAADGANHEDN